MVTYEIPKNWIKYQPESIVNGLAEAKAGVLSLQTIPYQRHWVEVLQQIELKREVAGTSRIEGAEFTEKELDVALKETSEQLLTRSQKQAHAAMRTYRWITTIPNDRPIDSGLICDIHSYIVTGADDDHCPPGRIRRQDQNVNFGNPRHRGVEGGKECEVVFAEFAQMLQRQYPEHDAILQALAAHYHLAAMHPFLDGNGRTARALEALLLQRAGLRSTSFIAMSNYYYEEKSAYLATLSEVRKRSYDLTPFMQFALKGITTQSRRLLTEIQHHISKELFRNLALQLFGRLKTPRKHVIAQRQLDILNCLLDQPDDSMEWTKLSYTMSPKYMRLKNPMKAMIRDILSLDQLGAITIEKIEEDKFKMAVRLQWPTEITETEFFKRTKQLPKAKMLSFLH